MLVCFLASEEISLLSSIAGSAVSPNATKKEDEKTKTKKQSAFSFTCSDPSDFQYEPSLPGLPFSTLNVMSSLICSSGDRHRETTAPQASSPKDNSSTDKGVLVAVHANPTTNPHYMDPNAKSRAGPRGHHGNKTTQDLSALKELRFYERDGSK